MATADPRRVIHAFGRLVANPTDLTTAFPYGGTALGLTADVIFSPNGRYSDVRAEEFGGELVEQIDGREDPVLAATIRGWDSDMLQRVFVRTAVGSSSGERVISYPGSVRAGSRGSDRAFILLFAPRNTEHHPAILFYRAISKTEDRLAIPLSQRREMVAQIVWRGIRDGSGRVYADGRLEDLSL